MSPIEGRMRFWVAVEGDSVIVRCVLTDETGEELAAFPVEFVKDGGFVEFKPVYLVIQVSGMQGVIHVAAEPESLEQTAGK